MITFENSKFDTVFGNLCLQLVPDPILVLKEVYRVCKVGARVGFSVWGR